MITYTMSHCAKLKFGVLLFDFKDAVQAGDGQ